MFDGIMCWPVTKAGSTCIQPCPSYMYKVLPNGKIIYLYSMITYNIIYTVEVDIFLLEHFIYIYTCNVDT